MEKMQTIEDVVKYCNICKIDVLHIFIRNQEGKGRYACLIHGVKEIVGDYDINIRKYDWLE